VDRKGQVYFVHGVRHRIMKIDAAGKLSTFAQGEDGRKLSVPHHLVLDRDDNLYSVGDRDGVIWKMAPAGALTQVYPPVDWHGITFIGSGGDPFTMDDQGNAYGINSRRDRYTQVLKIRPDGRLTVLAGGDYGSADGEGVHAKFGHLHGSCFAWGRDGMLFLTDSGVHIRKITPGGTVSTLADPAGQPVRFKGAQGLACDKNGNLYVADSSARRIYRVTPEGRVAAVAGSGQSGGSDGAALTATFEEPAGVAVGRDGTIYVLDYVQDDPRVRKISPDGMVSTVAKTSSTR
jgi:sugar lactone lactonase YvrE